jgi:hypothetical protein
MMTGTRSDGENSFADRIRARYPEGLTAAISIGGTRTAFILTQNGKNHDPGSIIADKYADYAHKRYKTLIWTFFDLGGQNLIAPVLAYQVFYDRGAGYVEQFIRFAYRLIGDEFQAFYRENGIDPYFAGIDTLMHLPPDQLGHKLGNDLAAFQTQWAYQDGRRKLIWEMAPIPLYTFWRAQFVMPPEEQARIAEKIESSDNMDEMYRLLFHYYAKAAFGTDIPMPHFYLASNRNGDLKLRAPMLLSLLCGGAFRMFYTPYPSLFTTREALQTILADLAFGKPLRSFKSDYGGQITQEMIDAERERVFALCADPLSTVGLTRTVVNDDGD